MIRFLVRVHPDGVREADDRGNLAVNLMQGGELARVLTGGSESEADAETGGAEESWTKLAERLQGGEAGDIADGELERLIETLGDITDEAKLELERRPVEESVVEERDDWMCPIGYQLFRHPVKAGDGKVYERKHILKWQKTNVGAGWKSPMTNLPCADFLLMPMDDMRRDIEAAVTAKLEETRRAAEAARGGAGTREGKGESRKGRKGRKGAEGAEGAARRSVAERRRREQSSDVH